MIDETRWTKESGAITGKDCNLLVAAAAGAGKTRSWGGIIRR